MSAWSHFSGRTNAASKHRGSERIAMSRQRNFWIPVICGGMILTIGIGARQSFGIFQKPIAADLNVGRELWSFASGKDGGILVDPKCTVACVQTNSASPVLVDLHNGKLRLN